jgi:hypothetical protein
MERLQVQQNGSFELTEADVDYTLDEEFKPGFYRQTAAFINETDQLPLSLDSLPDKIDTLYTIFGYSQ